ncbi:zinc finger protein 1 homolog isoform X2 [Plodia interpunctella]|uniref:zinc finger protein 1 homolog isoform X2 n=1 Tax=Plodia interpunctella TaxID=58824 RepID=UPI0023679D96|nr:zinc finger protein 1 homolog isoform X2 [Plodia interpunctella]
MSSVTLCRCCLVRPPDKDLKEIYKNLGRTEVYADMLKECFEIHLKLGDSEGDSGICEICVSRLRDSYDFKHQVQQCQREFQKKLTAGLSVVDEKMPLVKEEVVDPDDDNDIFFMDLKMEYSDYDMKEEDDKNLSEMLRFSNVTVKKKKKNGRTLDLQKSRDRKAKKVLTGPLKISLKAFSDKIKNPALTDMHFLSENKKHKLNVENVLKYSNATPFSNKTLSGIVCAYCKESCTGPDELRAHTQETHKNSELNDNKRIDKNNLSIKMDITDLRCVLCNTKVDVIRNLKTHLIKEHDIKFYPDVCDYILEFKLTAGEILNCALCNSTFETFKTLLQHMNNHYRNYICDVCDLGFINKHRLKNHKRTHEIGTFKCSVCEKVFSTRVRMMCHEKYTHNTNARYTTNCPHCNQSFTSYYQRNRHMFQEHNTTAASYKCNICDKSFILKSKLTSHIKKVHLMERNHVCAECGQGFFIKQSLDEHMIKHNGERVYKCTVCHKAYARKKTLREHLRIHNNDRRFKCGVCGLAFVQKCSLKSHMLSNHGVTLAEYESARADVVSP